MKEITYKYFVAEGPVFDTLVESAIKENTEYLTKVTALLKKYEATCGLSYPGGSMSKLGFTWEYDNDWGNAPLPPLKKGFLKPTKERVNNKWYACYKPSKNSKLGKSILADMMAVGKFNFSTYILNHTGVHDTVFGTLDNRQVMCHSYAEYRKNMLIFDIPVGGDLQEEFVPPVGFREIKKSEFIAITEE